jgi:hypothetical protein
VERIPLAVLVFMLAFAGMFPGWMIRLIESSLIPVWASLQQGRGLPIL